MRKIFSNFNTKRSGNPLCI